MRVISPTIARRLAISRQRLCGPVPEPGAAGMLGVIRDLGCLQLDPISAVDRSHRLVLWSRLGAYDPTDLDVLLWQERRLFEYWAHVASIVLTEDYPIHRLLMRTYGTGESRTASGKRLRTWVAENGDLRTRILDALAADGPLPARHFEDPSRTEWHSHGWTSGRSVSQMLDYLWTRGEIAVAGRQGLTRLWDLAERWLPEWTPREELPEREIVRRAVARSLRALGVARARHIQIHFTRHRYPGLAQVLGELEAEGVVHRVGIGDGADALPGPWYVHTDDLVLLDRLEAGEWSPRTTLLSPFDNLIADRARTEILWGFRYRVEIYVPPARREYGYYVLPILHGDRLVGRLDPRMDRKKGTLHVGAVWAEPDPPADAGTAEAIADAVEDLAAFFGAGKVDYGTVNGPAGWRRRLK
jgi:uncharacterized protein